MKRCRWWFRSQCRNCISVVIVCFLDRTMYHVQFQSRFDSFSFCDVPKCGRSFRVFISFLVPLILCGRFDVSFAGRFKWALGWCRFQRCFLRFCIGAPVPFYFHWVGVLYVTGDILYLLCTYMDRRLVGLYISMCERVHDKIRIEVDIGYSYLTAIYYLQAGFFHRTAW